MIKNKYTNWPKIKITATKMILLANIVFDGSSENSLTNPYEDTIDVKSATVPLIAFFLKLTRIVCTKINNAARERIAA